MNRKMCFCVPRALLGLAALLPLLTLGCSGQSGPATYELSGKVLYNGNPVPAGEVSFQPDGSQGNAGPGCIATITSGQYKTEPGTGVVGGAYIVRIVGYDGVPVGDSAQGKEMFPPYETKVDLPKEISTHDFEVPGSPARTR
ncbi:MAG: hypothetical protein ABFE01_12640 [Phycisphaerales bacterium]